MLMQHQLRTVLRIQRKDCDAIGALRQDARDKSGRRIANVVCLRYPFNDYDRKHANFVLS